MKEINSKNKRNSKKYNLKSENVNKNGVIKLMMPREVQNANSLIFSQINLNKYSWEEDGENVTNLFLKLNNRF